MKYAVSSLMVAVSALAFSANANASDFKPYVGLDYNYTDADADHQSPKYNSASVNVGTEYNKYFGTEVFYQYSDDDKKHVNGIENQTSFQAYGLDLMGYLPLGCDQVFSLVGTMGIGEYTFDKNYSGFYAPKDQRDHGIGYRFGGGLQYKIDDKFSVRGLVRYVNLNDGSVEGIEHIGRPVFTVQFHPEVCPGPMDTSFLFDRFLSNIDQAKGDAAKCL